MKLENLLIILVVIYLYPNLTLGQITIKRNNIVSKELANKFWESGYTLFDYTTDEPIFPMKRNEISIYRVYYSSYEDPRPHFVESTAAELEKLDFFKFKNRETCLKFCLAVPVLNKPSINTIAISSISDSMSISGGNIISDGGSTITSRGVVWSSSPNPTLGLPYKTIDGVGTGIFVSVIKQLIPNTIYFVKAYATNISGTSYGEEITFKTSKLSLIRSCPGIPTIKDIDGNTYNTVQIGPQCWMKENLRTTKYQNGTNIPLDNSGGKLGNDSIQTWSTRTEGARTVYGNNINNPTIYGYLYNWHALSDNKGLCPIGWNYPTESDWEVLNSFLGGQDLAGEKMKDSETKLWRNQNSYLTNESGFSALPGGFRNENGTFNNIGLEAYWWSSSDYNPKNSRYRYIGCTCEDSGFRKLYGSKRNGLSVRCIKKDDK